MVPKCKWWLSRYRTLFPYKPGPCLVFYAYFKVKNPKFEFFFEGLKSSWQEKKKKSQLHNFLVKK